MLIVEGPDGAGKSTLVKALACELGWPIAPRVVSQQAKAMVNLAEWTETNVEAGFQKTIFDRHRLISGPIYGSILRQHQDSKFANLPWLLEMYTKFYRANPIIIYCLPPLDTVMDNVLNGEDDNSVVWDTIPHIYALYAATAAKDLNFGHAYLYNYQVDFVDTFALGIKVLAQGRAKFYG